VYTRGSFTHLVGRKAYFMGGCPVLWAGVAGELQAQDEGPAAEARCLVTFRVKRRLFPWVKGVVQRLNPADAFDRLMRRPNPRFLKRPYQTDAISKLGSRVVYIHLECAIVPEDLEDDMPDGERSTKDNLAGNKRLLRGSNSGFVALYADT
jgi:hypothetical protein